MCTYVHIYAHLAHSSNITAVVPRTKLEIMVSIQILSDYLDILSDPEKLGSDIWLSTTSCSFHAHSDVTKSFVLRMSAYAFLIKFC